MTCGRQEASEEAISPAPQSRRAEHTERFHRLACARARVDCSNVTLGCGQHPTGLHLLQDEFGSGGVGGAGTGVNEDGEFVGVGGAAGCSKRLGGGGGGGSGGG